MWWLLKGPLLFRGLLCYLVLLLLCRAVTSGVGSVIFSPNFVVHTSWKWSCIVPFKGPKYSLHKKTVCIGMTAPKNGEKFTAVMIY